MTKSELAAQKCADLTNEKSNISWQRSHFKTDASVGGVFRHFVEHVSDLCEHAIASGDTSGLEELVLREEVDRDLLEAREIAAQGCEDCLMIATAGGIRTGHMDKSREVKTTLAALRRGREIERGEG